MSLTLSEWQSAKDELGRIREKCGHSQSHIARVAGVHPSYVWAIENGDKRPSVDVLAAYALECGLDSDELLHKWHRMPCDIEIAVRCNPHLWVIIRRELATQS